VAIRDFLIAILVDSIVFDLNNNKKFHIDI